MSVLRRRLWLILLCAVIGAAIAFAVSHSQPKVYTARASVLFRPDELEQDLFGGNFVQPTLDPDREAATDVDLLSLPVIAEMTSSALDGTPTPTAIKGEVAASAAGLSDVVNIDVTDGLPTRAAQIANEYVHQFVLYSRDQEVKKFAEAASLLKSSLSRLRMTSPKSPDIATMRTRLEELRVLAATGSGGAEVAQSASAPTGTSGPRTKRATAIGALTGLLIGLALAGLAEVLDGRLRDPAEAEEAFRLPVLATLPLSRNLARTTPPEDLSEPLAEVFRLLRARLRYLEVEGATTTVLVTSPGRADGKTTLAWRLALAAAEADPDGAVLLIEADLHQPTLGAVKGLEASPGLAEILQGTSTPDTAIQRFDVPTAQPSRLHVLTAGGNVANPIALLGGDRMRTLLAEAREGFSMVIIDAPPAPMMPDAIPLMRQVTGTLVVARVRHTSRASASSLEDLLQSLGVPVFGLVLNGSRQTGRSSVAWRRT